MGFIAAPIVGAIASWAVPASWTVLGSATLAASLVGSVAAGLTSMLFFKPKSPSGAMGSIKDSGLTKQVRQPVIEHRIIYGEKLVSGGITRMESTNNTKYLHMCITLSGHEVEEIGEIWVNDYPITDDMLDADGNVTEGRYKNYLRIRKHLGSVDQTADSLLVSETSADSNTRSRGRAYIYVRMRHNRDKYFSGIPNFSAYVKGKKLYDVRTETTYYSANPALMAYDYITNDTYGYQGNASDVTESYLISSANACDEFVETETKTFSVLSTDATDDMIEIDTTLLYLQTGDRVNLVGTTPSGLSSGTDYYVIPYQRKENDFSQPRIKLATSYANALAGTAIDITGTGSSYSVVKVAEPRYSAGGVIDTSQELQQGLNEMALAMGGIITETAGVFRILAGIYRTPEVSFNEDDILGGVKCDTRLPRRERVNTVKGVYISPINNSEPSDYPPVVNSTYKANDNGVEFIKDRDLNFVQRPHQAQRIAKIELERARQEITFASKFSMKAMAVRVGSVINLTFDRYGFDTKPFEVMEWKLNLPEHTIDMVLRETGSGVYDWNSGEETTVDIAPNTTLPDAFTVPVVSGFSLDSILVNTQSEDKIFKVVASWLQSENEFVASGGAYEIEVKRTTDSVYSSYAKVDGTVTQQEIVGLQPDITYDLRITAYNNIGVASASSEISGFVVGSTVTTNVEDWENETLSRDGDDWENDTLGSEDWES